MKWKQIYWLGYKTNLLVSTFLFIDLYFGAYVCVASYGSRMMATL